MSCDVVLAADCLLPGREGLFARRSRRRSRRCSPGTPSPTSSTNSAAWTAVPSSTCCAAPASHQPAVFRTTTCIRSTERPKYGARAATTRMRSTPPAQASEISKPREHGMTGAGVDGGHTMTHTRRRRHQRRSSHEPAPQARRRFFLPRPEFWIAPHLETPRPTNA